VEDAELMLMLDSVCVYRSDNRDRVVDLTEGLRRAGIQCVMLPSHQSIGTWDIEVLPDDAAAAREIVDGVGVH
jgi:hypothetical protein